MIRINRTDVFDDSKRERRKTRRMIMVMTGMILALLIIQLVR